MYKFREFQASDMEKINVLLGDKTLQSTWYTATTILGWLSVFEKRIYATEEVIILQVDIENKQRTFAPLIADASKLRETIKGLDANSDIGWDWIPAWQVPIFEELGYTVKALKNRWEYLYTSEGLRTLSGKKLHSKRNFINGFTSEYTFRAYEEEDFAGVIALFDAWYQDAITRVDANVAAITTDFNREKEVASYVLKNRELCNIIADVMIIEERIVGFVAGELMANEVGAIYFEKADTTYKGIYPMIDNLYCKAHFEEVEFINRQEDLGIAGLRKSKMSYCPIGFAELYKAQKR